MTDVTDAARRVAARFEAAKRAGHTDVALRMDEVIALLPVLDAVAAGRGDAGRVERWARAIAYETGYGGADIERMGWENWEGAARAVIALADAEKVAVRYVEPISLTADEIHGLEPGLVPMRAELVSIEAELVAIERQVRITCENDRNETSAKKADPVATMVEISLSHVTDAVRRIRAHLGALQSVNTDQGGVAETARREAIEEAAKLVEAFGDLAYYPMVHPQMPGDFVSQRIIAPLDSHQIPTAIRRLAVGAEDGEATNA